MLKIKIKILTFLFGGIIGLTYSFFFYETKSVVQILLRGNFSYFTLISDLDSFDFLPNKIDSDFDFYSNLYSSSWRSKNLKISSINDLDKKNFKTDVNFLKFEITVKDKSVDLSLLKSKLYGIKLIELLKKTNLINKISSYENKFMNFNQNLKYNFPHTVDSEFIKYKFLLDNNKGFSNISSYSSLSEINDNNLFIYPPAIKNLYLENKLNDIKNEWIISHLVKRNFEIIQNFIKIYKSNENIGDCFNDSINFFIDSLPTKDLKIYLTNINNDLIKECIIFNSVSYNYLSKRIPPTIFFLIGGFIALLTFLFFNLILKYSSKLNI